MVKLQQLVSEMMKKEGVKNYEVLPEGNSNLGDGYMGEMIFFKIVSKNGDKTYDLVVKLAATNKKVREISMMHSSFLREIYMYSTIFPLISSFLKEKNASIDIFENIPKMYWYCAEENKEAIILENLKAQGFEMWNRGEAVDFEHAKAVLIGLAKFHGIVMAFRDQKREQFNSLTPKLQAYRYEQCLKIGLVAHALKGFEKMLTLLAEKGNLECIEKYREILKNLDDHLLPADENDRLVFAHSDIWINNVLFKYEENGTAPTSLKFLDFQLSSHNTPLDDVSFFIYSACDGTLLNTKFDHLLEIYYSNLSETIKNLGSDPNSIFTFDDLQQHWKKYGVIGVLSAVELIKLQYFMEDEVPNFRELAEKYEDIKDFEKQFSIEIRNHDKYMERLLAVFTHYGNKYLK